MRMIQSLMLSASACLSLVGCGETPVEKEPVVRPIKIHKIGSLAPMALREYPGTIRAWQTAEMGFEVPGRVTEFLVRESDKVEKGQVLARLDARDYRAELKVAAANLEKSKADLTRSLTVQKRAPGSMSQQEIEVNERAVKVTEAEWEIKQKAVDDTELRAPFAGVMARKLVEDFANVKEKEPVLILQDNSTLEIDVAIPERDVAGRKNVQETKEETTARLNPKIMVSAIPDQEFDAKIKEFAMVANPETRTFSVKLNFETPENVNILPGMTARVRIVFDPTSAWSVPVTAAQADAKGQSHVWRVNPNGMTVSQSPVELGPLVGDPDRVLLKSGVEEGDLVAISGVTALREGMKVREYKN